MKKIIVIAITSILLSSGILVGAGNIENIKEINYKDDKELKIKENILTIESIFNKLLDLIPNNTHLEEKLIKYFNDINNIGSLNGPDCFINLPSSVEAYITEVWGAAPFFSYLSTELFGITEVCDVENTIYPGWCLDYHTPLPFDYFVEPDAMPIPVMLYSSYCPPDFLIDDGWDEVNYILNNKHPSAGWNDIHIAINQFVNFGDPIPPPTLSSIAGQMVIAANANPNFEPQPGDIIAVIVDPLESSIGIEPPFINEWGDDHCRWQYTIIEVPVPFDDGDCTLTFGYWKTHGDPSKVKKYDRIWNEILPSGPDSEFFSTGESYIEILWTNPGKNKDKGLEGGNAYIILAVQYIAALLNGIKNNGYPNSPDIGTVLSNAENLLNSYSTDMEIPKGGIPDDRAEAISLAGTLDDFNNGRIPGWPHCED